MNRNTLIAITVITILLIIGLYLYSKNKEGEIKKCFTVPTSPDPQTFGPSYWKAFHSLASDIPCPNCRGFAEKFMIFFHDVVNKKLDKPLYDSENYQEIKNYIATQ